MLGQYLNALREQGPLIHCITNTVTMNDCANALLAVGGSPIMADDPDEVAEIAVLAGGVVLNIGTLRRQNLNAFYGAGREAARRGIPVVLDPVGAGASRLRTETARGLWKELPLAAIRCNLSELRALLGEGGGARGVDAAPEDLGATASLRERAAQIGALARRAQTVVAVTGEVDFVSDGARTFAIRGGHPLMARVTGTGCMLTAVTGAFLAASPEQPLEAAAAAVCAMGLCGARAHRRLLEETGREGTGSYRVLLMDELACLTGGELDGGEDIEIFERAD